MIFCMDIGNTSVSDSIWDINKNKFLSIIPNRWGTGKKEICFSDPHGITSVAITSVVPMLTDYYKNYFQKTLNIEPFIVNHQNCGINLKVENPNEVGADRICNAVGAKEKYRTPCLIIDFGSATTYDIVDNKGDFIGGAIAPGIDVSANYLIEKAALLNDTIFQFPKNVIGKNTNTNLQSGIMYGGLDSVQGMIKRIIDELNEKNIKIILTGGFSSLISSHLEIEHRQDQNLTLYGLKEIHNNNE